MISVPRSQWRFTNIASVVGGQNVLVSWLISPMAIRGMMGLPDDALEHREEVQAEDLADVLVREPPLDQTPRDVRPILPGAVVRHLRAPIDAVFRAEPDDVHLLVQLIGEFPRKDGPPVGPDPHVIDAAHFDG